VAPGALGVMETNVVATQVSIDDIRRAVGDLLRRARVAGPPVDLLAIARLQGIERVEFAKLGPRLLGKLREKRGELTVTLNERQPHRSRFTLAHEIAHTMLEPFGNPRTKTALAHRNGRRGSALERLCDEVAVELLFPYELFRHAVAGLPPAIGAVTRTARLFDASLEATALRYGEVAPGPVEVVSWRQQGSGLKVKASRGTPLVAASDCRAVRSLSDASSPVARAFRSRGAERGLERPYDDMPWIAHPCEAQGFLRGEARYVLSLITPATAGAAADTTPDRRDGALAPSAPIDHLTLTSPRPERSPRHGHRPR